MSKFNKLYHGNAQDVSEVLEAGVELTPAETGALFCNIMRKLAILEQRTGRPPKLRRIYIVKVRPTVGFWALHDLDADEIGDGQEYPMIAVNEEDALDQFHSTVPIKVLDDFEITVEAQSSEA